MNMTIFSPSISNCFISLAILAIDASSSTSNGKISMPKASRPFILAGFLEVAYTFRPALWNAIASPAPKPPSEHPVIKTVFFGLDIQMCKREGFENVEFGDHEKANS
jgi:hypothetical protein